MANNLIKEFMFFSASMLALTSYPYPSPRVFTAVKNTIAMVKNRNTIKRFKIFYVELVAAVAAS